jgi:hypothetical protein
MKIPVDCTEVESKSTPGHFTMVYVGSSPV